MLRIYSKLKNKVVKYPTYSGIVCGYTENRLILATEDNPRSSFRKFEKGGAFIEEQFKDSKYRYVYADEKDVYNSNPKLKSDYITGKRGL